MRKLIPQILKFLDARRRTVEQPPPPPPPVVEEPWQTRIREINEHVDRHRQRAKLGAPIVDPDPAEGIK